MSTQIKLRRTSGGREWYLLFLRDEEIKTKIKVNTFEAGIIMQELELKKEKPTAARSAAFEYYS